MPLESYAEIPNSDGDPARINEITEMVRQYWDEPLTVIAIVLGDDARARGLLEIARAQIAELNEGFGDLHRLLWIQRPEDARDTPIAALLRDQTAFLLVTRQRALSARWPAARLDASLDELYVESMRALHRARAGESEAGGDQ